MVRELICPAMFQEALANEPAMVTVLRVGILAEAPVGEVRRRPVWKSPAMAWRGSPVIESFPSQGAVRESAVASVSSQVVAVRLLMPMPHRMPAAGPARAIFPARSVVLAVMSRMGVWSEGSRGLPTVRLWRVKRPSSPGVEVWRVVMEKLEAALVLVSVMSKPEGEEARTPLPGPVS